jgi:NAD(P)-dependent dehydrogenase (short-subunit alcohol dehydrogenase family)
MGLTTDVQRRYNDYLSGDSRAVRLHIMLVCSLLVLSSHRHFDIFLNCKNKDLLSATTGETGFSNLSSYCASKFGLVGLAESLKLEVAAYNIRVMTIFLGRVATKMWQDYDYDYYERNKLKHVYLLDISKTLLKM